MPSRMILMTRHRFVSIRLAKLFSYVPLILVENVPVTCFATTGETNILADRPSFQLLDGNGGHP